MANELLDAALAYAARGWPIFPCRSDKTPYLQHGVLDATTDPATITGWWAVWPRAGIGLDVGGAGMMVIDLDAYKPGYDRAVIEAALGGLPETKLEARSPRGGEHLFYALAPSEVAAPSSSKIAPHCDVRGFHSYVLLAPSRTDDGAYEWVSEGKPTYRTDDMLRLANTGREKSQDRDSWIIEPDLPENVASAVAWLQKDAKPAIQGHGGDHTAYATAAMMKSYGLSEALAFDLIWEHYNPRCVPPWTADEVDHLETKVRNGYSYNTSPPGNVTPAYRVARSASLFQPVMRAVAADAAVSTGGLEASNGRFRIINRAGMDGIEPPEWLIPDFLPAGGYALMVGVPGTFKTFIALDIALTIATGGSWPWEGMWEGVKQGPVLFCVGEGRPEFKKRVAAWERTYRDGAQADDFYLADPVPAPKSEDWEHFIAAAKAMSPDGYRLVVLDTVGRSMQGLNENAQENASAFTALVEAIQRELGATVLALHHAGHDGNRARGSSVFGADADTVVVLDRKGQDYIVSMSNRREDNGKQKDAAEWDKPKLVRLGELKLDMEGTTSLVAMKPAPAEIAKATDRADDAKAAKGTLDHVLDNAVVDVLKSNRLKAWTSKELAAALAMRDEIDVKSGTLANHNLPDLRETKGTQARRMYDPAAKRWRYVGD